MILILPVCSTTNSRPDPSPALVTSSGCDRPSATGSRPRWIRDGATARGRRRQAGANRAGRRARGHIGARAGMRGSTARGRIGATARLPVLSSTCSSRGPARASASEGARRCPSPICPWPSCGTYAPALAGPGRPRRVLGDDPGRGATRTTWPPRSSRSTTAWPSSRPSTSRSPASADRRSGPGSTCRPVAPGPLPAVVEYVGYGGGRGLAARAGPVGRRRLRPPRDGYARPGLDAGRSATRPTRTRPVPRSIPGFMTQGILDPRDLLLPARLHRCGARGRGGPGAPGRRCRRGWP